MAATKQIFAFLQRV